MTPDEQLRLIKSSKRMHTNWYKKTYPDVADLGMEPALHYLRYGAAMGRNPGKNFDTRYYLRTCPEAAKSGLNPLVHYVLHGSAKGVATSPPKKPGARHVSTLRAKLLSLGFTDRPLEELAEVQANAKLRETRALASRELALWHMRAKTPEGWSTALKHLDTARADAPDLDFRRKLSVDELLCHHFLGDEAAARDTYERAVIAGEGGPDLLLARANLERRPEARVALMNRVLAHYDIAPVTLGGDSTQPAYDRLTVVEPLPPVTDGPKVTVLIAAYEAADTLPTALRSLQEQTWQNLEILVLDDCSPSPDTGRVAEEFAARDPRIRLIRMEQNAGAYVARNRGLDEATGAYVTLHDADDWSHPAKIETQVRFMQEHPNVMGCTTQQARATTDLFFERWTGNGQFIITNTSSFMFRRDPVKARLGYWDTVRFGADMELIRRIQTVWGKDAIHRIPNSVFSFQRDSSTSIVADDALGASTLPFGVRRQYVEAQLEKHLELEKLKYDGNREKRPFVVPRSMLDTKASLTRPPHYDVIISSDFRMIGGSTVSNSQELACQKKGGLRSAIFPMFRYDFGGLDRPIQPEIWGEVDGDKVDLLAYGQAATCDLLILRYPPILYHRQKFIPKIDAKEIRVIVNQPPKSDYGPEGVVRYKLADCAANVRHYFGKDAVWHPIGPLVRDALHNHHAEELHHIDLSDQDWSNIIDIEGWDRGSYRPQGKLKIGRHSRDHDHKWPTSREDIIAAYPAAKDVEVHVLGGGRTPKAILGKTPDNWTVHEFGSLHPREFLKDIDVWIYFANPDWIESFGRTIIEAMATGVPVILPEVYRPLFKEAALYATPATAVKIARRLHADPAAYRAQVKRAQAYVRANFSYEMHLARVKGFKSVPMAASDPAAITMPAVATLAPAPEPTPAPAPTPTPVSAVPAPAAAAPEAAQALTSIPKQSGKVSGTSLADLPRLNLNAGAQVSPSDTALLECVSGGHRFDYLWKPKPGAKRLFVLFSGDAMRKSYNPPVFQRWSWADHFPGHCLYVSDPMLYMSRDLGLTWYAGTADLDPMEVIIRRVQAMLPLVGLTAENVVAYGSSGGGFAALRMASMMEGATAIAINPQTNIAKYERRSPDRYAKICLKRADRHEALADFPMRMNLLCHADRLAQRRIIVIQNLMDTHHHSEHYLPFCAAMGATGDENRDTGTFRRILFSHEGGHGKAETPEAFTAALDILQADFADTSRVAQRA